VGQIVKEKRLRFLPLKTSSRKSYQRRSIESFGEFSMQTINSEIANERSKRPGRLLPLQLL